LKEKFFNSTITSKLWMKIERKHRKLGIKHNLDKLQNHP